MVRRCVDNMKFYFSVILFLSIFDFDRTSAEHFPILNYIFGSKSNRTFAIIEEAVGNTECAKDLRIFFNDLAQKKRWALQMFDATGKYAGGLLAGQINILGNFDQCLNITNDKKDSPIIGQYCKVYVRANEKYPSKFVESLVNPIAIAKSIGMTVSNNSIEMLRWLKINYGLCLPHSCTSNNLQNISQTAEHTLKLPFQLEINDYNCRNRNKQIVPFDYDKYIISFFCVYVALLLLSTCYDFMIPQSDKGNCGKILLAFSVLRNGKQLFAAPPNMESRLDALNGIKVVQMIWIIFAHRYLFNIVSGITNLLYINEFKNNMFASILQSASYAVDSFLVLSGLLLSYFFLKHMGGSKNGKFPILKMYFYRFLRLSPSLLAMILFYISIFKYLGDGPDWVQIAGRFSVTCSRNWWATALYINNYLEYSYVCVDHSWYLAVDTQLFFLSPVLLMNLIRRPWKTCLACIVICVCSGIYTYVITIQHNLGALFLHANKEYVLSIYYPTLVRMPPWFIGIVFGYLIYKYGHINLNRVSKCLAWICTLVSLCIPVYVQSYLNRRGEYNAVHSALCNSCTRQIWGIGIGILSYLCSTGNGGNINKFLSLPIFQVMARFCYGVYLTHVPVIAYFIGEKRHPEYFATVKVSHQAMGDIPFIFVAATIWILAFESPFRVIGKLINPKDITIEKIDDQRPHNCKNKENSNKPKVNFSCISDDELCKKNY